MDFTFPKSKLNYGMRRYGLLSSKINTSFIVSNVKVCRKHPQWVRGVFANSHKWNQTNKITQSDSQISKQKALGSNPLHHPWGGWVTTNKSLSVLPRSVRSFWLNTGKRRKHRAPGFGFNFRCCQLLAGWLEQEPQRSSLQYFYFIEW